MCSKFLRNSRLTTNQVASPPFSNGLETRLHVVKNLLTAMDKRDSSTPNEDCWHRIFLQVWPAPFSWARLANCTLEHGKHRLQLVLYQTPTTNKTHPPLFLKFLNRVDKYCSKDPSTIANSAINCVNVHVIASNYQQKCTSVCLLLLEGYEHK